MNLNPMGKRLREAEVTPNRIEDVPTATATNELCPNVSAVLPDNDKQISGSNVGTENILELPHKYIYFVNDKTSQENLFKIKVEINDVFSVCALIDSGSVYSLISSDLVKEHELKVTPNPTKLRVLGDQIMTTLGETKCSLKVGDLICNDVNFLVFPSNCSIGSSLFLGIDFLIGNRIEVNIGESI